MDRKYNVFLVSDSTGETLDRIFLALKAQFENFNNNLHHFSFVRTEAQIATLLEKFFFYLKENFEESYSLINIS